jgi:S-adenosyl-L-methionine hydrolase (adenosine-forming)
MTDSFAGILNRHIQQPEPIITLLTDFGTRDGFIGVMKGVMMHIAPNARFVDISHDLPPFSIAAASFLLAWSFRYFPPGTVHLCVVDPGVGTSRRVLIAEACGHIFVAPDNGILTPLFDVEYGTSLTAATHQKFWMDKVSHTFHGRDIFAPVAAYLATGVKAGDMGETITDPVRLDSQPLIIQPDSIVCHIQYIDRFGNLITNLDSYTFRSWLRTAGVEPSRLIITWIEHSIQGISRTYGDRNPGEFVAVFNGFDRFEIAINNGNAHKTTRLTMNDRITISIP